MIHIDQVRTLEIKVKQAVQLVVHLRRENDHLRSRLTDTEVRIQEMEELLAALKSAQTQMELGIQSALNDLGQIEAGSPVVEDEGDLTQVSSRVQLVETSDQTEVSQDLGFSGEREASETFELPVHSEPQEIPTESLDESQIAPEEREIEQSGLGLF